jgi:hypothetical protein
MASLDLRPIDDSNIDIATSMLMRGFPDHTQAFWSSGLERIRSFHDPARHGPIGYLFTVDGEVAGIILTIPSCRHDSTGCADVVHLSCWYMAEPHRWLAARMMKKVTTAAGTVLFDLTPNPAARAINRRLGFDVLDEGVLIYLLPVTALRLAGAAEVWSFERAEPRMRSEDAKLLRQHRALGCIVGALHVDDTLTPIIFTRSRRQGISGARLIRVDSKKLVTDNLGAISRFLLRQNVLFLRMNATRNDSVAGSLMARWNRPTFIKGPRGSAEVDLTYSEFVFLGIP